jgi:hypothetical protein
MSCSNVGFHNEKMVKGWFFKKERIVPVIRARKEVSFITMEHDLIGYYLFSNEACRRYTNTKSFPSPTGIT